MDGMGRQLLNEFSTRQWARVRKDAAQDAYPSHAGILVQPQFFTSSPILRNKNRAQERQQPTEKGDHEPPIILASWLHQVPTYSPTTQSTQAASGG